MPVVGWQLGLAVYGTYPNYFGMQNANTKDIKTEFTSRNTEVMQGARRQEDRHHRLQRRRTARCSPSRSPSRQPSKTKGLKIVYMRPPTSRWAPPSSARCADQIKQSGADSDVHHARQRREHRASMSALKQAGVNAEADRVPRWLQPAACSACPTYDDVYFGIEFKPFETTARAGKGIDDYKKWMAQPRPRAPRSARPPRWDGSAANTMIEGIKAAGVNCPTRKAFINNLRLEKGYTADGFFDDPRRRSTSPRSTASRSRACTTCRSRTSSSCRSSTASRSARKKLITDNKITQGRSRPRRRRAAPPTTAAP